MTYTSQNIGPIIDDSNYLDVTGDVVVDGEQKLFGLEPRNFDADPFGSGFKKAFDLPIIPREEWPERIEAMERTKSRITDICDAVGLGVLDQNGTNYCWINAPVRCVEICRALAGQQQVRLSPASCGALIKRYRNVGGWCSEGLEYIVEHGIAPQSMWPANAIDRQYDNVETKRIRQQYRVTEWYDVVDIRGDRASQRFEKVMTLLLNRIPVAVGLNWWGHAISLVDPVSLGGGRFGARIDNSWGKRWKENGRSVLTESRATPDDAVAPCVATAS